MMVYGGTEEHDLLLAQWWGIMRQRGELASTLAPELAPLGAFMRWCGSPRTVVFDTDADGVTAAAWYEPTLRGAWFGFWLAPRLRHRRVGLHVLETALRAGLANWPILLASVRDESVGRMLCRLGYTMTGPVFGLMDPDAPSWVGWLTQEGFDNGWRRRQGRRRHSRQHQRDPGPGDVRLHQGVL